MIKDIDILKKNRKGITLVELILYLAIVTMIAPMVFQIFMFGYNSYKTGFNYIEQQKRINEAIQHIQRDVEVASYYYVDVANNKLTLKAYNSLTQKVWSFSGGALKLDGRTIVDGLDTSSCFSEKPLEHFIVLKIKADEKNKTINKNRNVKDTIITEFSVKYK